MSAYVLLRDFMEAGGDVLWAILVATALLWWLLLDRYYFLLREYKGLMKTTLARWQEEPNKNTWYGDSVRKQLISEVDCALSKNMVLIPSIVALLPMLGLLGTVTGMIQVFDVLAVTGSSNARLMADGVSAATIPTMAGMVAALTALPLSSGLESRYRKEVQNLNDVMSSEMGVQ